MDAQCSLRAKWQQKEELVPRLHTAPFTLPEGLATLAALERLLRVDQLVAQQDGALLEGFAALCAPVWLGPGVDDLVRGSSELYLNTLPQVFL